MESGKVKSYKDLMVWQRSIQLVKEVYTLSRLLPKEEMFGLANQMRRAAVSIPSNIAEGQQRHNRKEYRQFLGIALGSVAELETQLIVAHDNYDLEVNAVVNELTEIQRMLHAIAKKLNITTS